MTCCRTTPQHWVCACVRATCTACATTTSCTSPPCARFTPDAGQPNASNKLQTITRAHSLMVALMRELNCLCTCQTNNTKIMQSASLLCVVAHDSHMISSQPWHFQKAVFFAIFLTRLLVSSGQPAARVSVRASDAVVCVCVCARACVCVCLSVCMCMGVRTHECVVTGGHSPDKELEDHCSPLSCIDHRANSQSVVTTMCGFH